MNGRTSSHKVHGMISFAKDGKLYMDETQYIVRVTSDELGNSLSIEDPRLNLMYQIRLEGELRNRLQEVLKHGRNS